MKIKKNPKKPQLELIKSIDGVLEVANLILTLINKHSTQFIFLNGEIGVGKTTLVKSIAKKLNENEVVISPSFNKMLVYDKFIHIDAYNMQNQTLDEFRDFFDSKIVIIEWVENLNDVFNEGLVVDIFYFDEKTRKYHIYWKD